ncbi:nuclear envelope integral membrane protein 1-like isoform X2 [Stegodyphus dumicola]|nr:nuclear envelope integral membrane protein 1-like isoform X2 [Stegodyphus dumicola]
MFSGDNETDVFNKYGEKSTWLPTSWLYEQDKTIGFPAFSEYCVGLYTGDSYVLSLEVRTINYWRFLQTVIGILLFLSAPSLSRNPFFHYTSGVSFGVLASLLILFYVVSRFIPKKSASYLVLAFGWSFVLYILQVLWRDLNNIVSNYKDIIMVYCFVVAFLSFLVCYRFGPVENIRTFKIIQYSMQVIAVLVIFFSSEYREVSTAIVLILVTGKWIPIKWLIKFQYLWYRFFPPKVKLLTELEYIEQGHIETKKALENLRQYCHSPDCNAWKVIAKLRNPVRFAQFIENGTQYTDEELLEYNSEEFFDNEFHHSSYSDDDM